MLVSSWMSKAYGSVFIVSESIVEGVTCSRVVRIGSGEGVCSVVLCWSFNNIERSASNVRLPVSTPSFRIREGKSQLMQWSVHVSSLLHFSTWVVEPLPANSDILALTPEWWRCGGAAELIPDKRDQPPRLATQANHPSIRLPSLRHNCCKASARLAVSYFVVAHHVPTQRRPI